MKMFYLIGVIAFASLLAFVGCSPGTDPEATPEEDPATIPSSLDDADKAATDQSVELLEEVEEKIVAKADTLAKDETVVFSVNDKDVASTITAVGAAPAASGGRSIPAAAETPAKVISFEFDDGEEIEGTQTVTTYEDGSWDMEGTATFKDVEDIEGIDGAKKNVPIQYKKTKVDKDGKITGGNIEVDGTAIETKAFNALKKIAVFYKKLNKKLPATQQGVAPDLSSVMTIDMEQSLSNVKQDGSLDGALVANKTFETYDALMKDEEIQEYQSKLMTGYTMSASGMSATPTFVDGSFEWTETTKTTMNAKADAGFTYDSTLTKEVTTSIESSVSAKKTTMTVSSSSTLTINAEADGMSIAFTNVKNTSENSMVLPHKTLTQDEMEAIATPSEDEQRFRWTGSITVDGTKIDVSGAKMDVMSKLLFMGAPKREAGNPGGGGTPAGGDGNPPAGDGNEVILPDDGENGPPTQPI